MIIPTILFLHNLAGFGLLYILWDTRKKLKHEQRVFFRMQVDEIERLRLMANLESDVRRLQDMVKLTDSKPCE